MLGCLFLLASVSVGPAPDVGATKTPLAPDVQRIVRGLNTYARRNLGASPPHAITLVTHGYLSSADLLSAGSKTTKDRVPMGSITLAKYDALPPAYRMQIATAVAAALPANTTAYRFGDFVFNYRGIDVAKANPKLWLVIRLPMPSVNPNIEPNGEIAIGLAGGDVLWLEASKKIDALVEQNKLRKRFGLPPLTNPFAVTHAKPATSPTKSE